MALALNEVIAVGTMKSLWANAHHPVIEDIEYVEAREIPAGMTGLASLNQSQQRFAVLNGLSLKFEFSEHAVRDASNRGGMKSH